MEAPSTTFCNYLDEAVTGASPWGEETFFFSHEFQQMNIGVQPSNYPDRLGIFSDVAVSALPVSNSTHHGGADPNFGGNNVYSGSAEGCDLGSGCCYDFDYYKTIDHAVRDNWGMEEKSAEVVPVVEDSGSRVVGRYTVEERKDRILRYLKKRNQRNFNKTIKYACRKTLADRRVRVRGRFARNSGSCEDEMQMAMPNEADPSQRNDLFFGDSLQMKQDGDEWLQAAIASLIYLPYVSG